MKNGLIHMFSDNVYNYYHRQGIPIPRIIIAYNYF